MADDNDQFDQLAKLRAQLAQSRAACARLDKDNRSMRQSLRVPRFEELETVEQDVMLEHFLQVRFGSYDDEGEAGWELLRMLAQEPTWTPAVYDRSWAPSSVHLSAPASEQPSGCSLGRPWGQPSARYSAHYSDSKSAQLSVLW